MVKEVITILVKLYSEECTANLLWELPGRGLAPPPVALAEAFGRRQWASAGRSARWPALAGRLKVRVAALGERSLAAARPERSGHGLICGLSGVETTSAAALISCAASWQ
jgi:hypothetical protein